LVDRGFIDGVLLWWLWKRMKIRFVIPARSNMEVSQDIRGFRSALFLMAESQVEFKNMLRKKHLCTSGKRFVDMVMFGS
jgi:hypothetical protein